MITLPKLYGIFRAVQIGFQNAGMKTTAEAMQCGLDHIDEMQLDEPGHRLPRVVTRQDFNRVLAIIRKGAIDYGYGGLAKAVDKGIKELERLDEEERIPPSNASEMAPEPPASLKALVERWRLLSHQRRIALGLAESDETDFSQCARELEDVLAKKKLLLTPIYNPRIAADLETMRKRAESAERTLELIKENLS